MKLKNYYVYIMTNKIRTVFYIGVTNDLERRFFEHTNPQTKCFTQKYKCFYLIYFETHISIKAAIVREKRMKKWKREWKLNLIQEINPLLKDLSEQIIAYERFPTPRQ